MKIIATDMYGREIPDRLICPAIEELDGKLIVNLLNTLHEGGEWFYKLVEDKDVENV